MSAQILVMDDEQAVRVVSPVMLDELSYEVQVAKNGGEALQLYQEPIISGKRFDVVILDLTVRGGMGGSETMKRLGAIDPAVKAIL